MKTLLITILILISVIAFGQFNKDCPDYERYDGYMPTPTYVIYDSVIQTFEYLDPRFIKYEKSYKTYDTVCNIRLFINIDYLLMDGIDTILNTFYVEYIRIKDPKMSEGFFK